MHPILAYFYVVTYDDGQGMRQRVAAASWKDGLRLAREHQGAQTSVTAYQVRLAARKVDDGWIGVQIDADPGVNERVTPVLPTRRAAIQAARAYVAALD